MPVNCKSKTSKLGAATGRVGGSSKSPAACGYEPLMTKHLRQLKCFKRGKDMANCGRCVRFKPPKKTSIKVMYATPSVSSTPNLMYDSQGLFEVRYATADLIPVV